jgi:hypothetical protein
MFLIHRSSKRSHPAHLAPITSRAQKCGQVVASFLIAWSLRFSLSGNTFSAQSPDNRSDRYCEVLLRSQTSQCLHQDSVKVYWVSV